MTRPGIVSRPTRHGIIAGGGMPALWTPADLATLVARYRGYATGQSDGPIDTWDDSDDTGPYDLAQATPAGQPTLAGNKVEVSTGDSMANASALVSGNPDLTIAMIVEPRANLSVQDRLVQLGDNGAGTGIGLTCGASYSWRFGNGAVVYNSVGFADQLLVGVRIAGSTYAAGSKFYQNGTEKTASSVVNGGNSPNVAAGVLIGAFATVNTDAIYSEIIIAEDSTLDTKYRLEGFLAWDWDTRNGNTARVDALDVAHPYKDAPPYK